MDKFKNINQYKQYLQNKHGWAISRTDDKYVYFIDPNVGTEEWHISIEDFKKAFDTCAVATLD